MLTHGHPVYKAVTYMVQSQARRSSEKLSPATRANLQVTRGSNSHLSTIRRASLDLFNQFLYLPLLFPPVPSTSLPLPDSLLKQRQEPPLFALITEEAVWEVGVLFGGEAG